MAEKFGLGNRPQQSGGGGIGGHDLEPMPICDFRTIPYSAPESIITA
jgi:hypothetical protein